MFALFFLEEGEDGSEEEEEYILFILRVDIFLVTIFHKVLSEGGVGLDPSSAPPPLATHNPSRTWHCRCYVCHLVIVSSIRLLA